MSSATAAARWSPPPECLCSTVVCQRVVALLSGRLSRAQCVPGGQELPRHDVVVHTALVGAIAHRDQTVFDALAGLHDRDLVRADAPDRSPQVPCDRSGTGRSGTAQRRSAQQVRRRPAGPLGHTDEPPTHVASDHAEGGGSAGVVLERGPRGDCPGSRQQGPHPVVAVEDLQLRDVVAPVRDARGHPSDRQARRNHHDVPVDQDPNRVASATRSSLLGWLNTVSVINEFRASTNRRRCCAARCEASSACPRCA